MILYALLALLLAVISLVSMSVTGGLIPAQWLIYLIVFPGAVLALLLVPPTRRPLLRAVERLRSPRAADTEAPRPPPAAGEAVKLTPALLHGRWKGTARLWPLDRRAALRLFDVRLAFDPRAGTVASARGPSLPPVRGLVAARLRGIDWDAGRLEVELTIENDAVLQQFPARLRWQAPSRQHPQPRLVTEPTPRPAGGSAQLALELVPDAPSSRAR
jgi:hypothetical protein